MEEGDKPAFPFVNQTNLNDTKHDNLTTNNQHLGGVSTIKEDKGELHNNNQQLGDTNPTNTSLHANIVSPIIDKNENSSELIAIADTHQPSFKIKSLSEGNLLSFNSSNPLLNRGMKLRSQQPLRISNSGDAESDDSELECGNISEQDDPDLQQHSVSNDEETVAMHIQEKFLRDWIELVTATKMSDNMIESLKDGDVLCRYVF